MIRLLLNSSLAIVAGGGVLSSVGYSLISRQPLSAVQIISAISLLLLAIQAVAPLDLTASPGSAKVKFRDDDEPKSVTAKEFTGRHPPNLNVNMEAAYFYAGAAIAALAAMGMILALWQHRDILRTIAFACLSVGLAISTFALIGAEQKMAESSAEDIV